MIKNIFANFFGFFWSILSNFLFVPIYISLLGFESYSIITFTLLIISFISILENGLSTTISRELARSDISQQKKNEIFSSLESLYLLIILIFCFTLFSFSKVISQNIIKPTSLSLEETSLCIRIFSFEIIFNLIIKFYVGAFNGLEKQVKANFLIVLWSIFRNGFVIFVILFFPSLLNFFLFQLFISIIFFLVIKRSIHKELKNNIISLKINLPVVRPILGFTIGILLISIVSSISTLLDRMLISNYFSVKELAYYTLAVSISSAVYFLTKPISVAVLPTFTKLVTKKAISELNNLFYTIFSFCVMIISTIMWTVYFYSINILEIWTGNNLIAEKSHIFLQLLVIGYSVSSLQHFFYDIAVANKNTKINNIIGILTVVIVLPAYYIAITYFGSSGLAMTFSIIQILVTFIYIFYINKMYLTVLSNKKIFFVGIISPFISSFILIYFSKFIFNSLDIKNKYAIISFCITSALSTIIFLLLFFGKFNDIKKISNLIIKK